VSLLGLGHYSLADGLEEDSKKTHHGQGRKGMATPVCDVLNEGETSSGARDRDYRGGEEGAVVIWHKGGSKGRPHALISALHVTHKC